MSKCRAPPARESRPPPGVPIAANPNAEPLAPRRGGGGSGLAGVLALAGGYVAPPPNMVQVGASKSQLRSKLREMIMVLTYARCQYYQLLPWTMKLAHTVWPQCSASL